mgnify:FL=1|tara:strand:+ start:206 stop:478 length:273 start_codon:yes stop_codon:yes gene_type:complete
MNRVFEDFLSNQWNIYGLQVLAGLLMVMILHQYLTLFQLCVMGLCVFVIAFCQRLLGIRFGMIYYEINRDKLKAIMRMIRRTNNKEKDNE